jgi:hypothetical protein
LLFNIHYALILKLKQRENSDEGRRLFIEIITTNSDDTLKKIGKTALEHLRKAIQLLDHPNDDISLKKTIS